LRDRNCLEKMKFQLKKDDYKGWNRKLRRSRRILSNWRWWICLLRKSTRKKKRRYWEGSRISCMRSRWSRWSWSNSWRNRRNYRICIWKKEGKKEKISRRNRLKLRMKELLLKLKSIIYIARLGMQERQSSSTIQDLLRLLVYLIIQ